MLLTNDACVALQALLLAMPGVCSLGCLRFAKQHLCDV